MNCRLDRHGMHPPWRVTNWAVSELGEAAPVAAAATLRAPWRSSPSSRLKTLGGLRASEAALTTLVVVSTTPKARAAIYLRQSFDRTGEGMAVDRQLKVCRRIARDRGWTVVDEYIDNSVSASKRSVIRPRYDRMEQDYRAGRFDALICWDLDRLTRQPRQLEDWIEQAEERGLLLTTANGEADLSTDNGRLFARIKASVARSEVERKSSRQRAANDQRAEAGAPHAGRRAFGYAADGKGIQKKEAEEFRRAVDAVIEGVGLRTLATDLNHRGVTTTAGNPWKPTELRRLLQNPRHAGLRVHRGEVVGLGQWPPIIDEDAHRAVVAILSDPARRPRGRPRVYLLSGVAQCGVCGEEAGARIYGRAEHRGPIYVCEARAHLGRKTEPVDDYVERVIVARLSRPDAAGLFARPDNGPRLTELRAEDRQVTARLQGLAEAFATGDIDRRQLVAGTSRLRDRAEVLAGEIASMTAVPALAPLSGAEDVTKAWRRLSVCQRREVIGALVKVTLFAPGRGARSFDPKTIGIEWKGVDS